MRALSTARVDWSVTSVLSPSASRRTQPVTSTSPSGGAGTSAVVAPRLSVANQPRSTSRLVPSSSSRGTTTSAPAFSLRWMISLRSCRSASRWNCHSPSRHATHARKTTTSAKAIQRRETRNRSLCTRRGYPSRPEHPAGGAAPVGRLVIVMTPLADRFGRVATDLRVSLTDRCNLRCNYCMPAEGLDWLPTDQTLTDDEVVRLITIGVERLGVREVRFTGGEPLLRRGLVDIVGRTHALGVETSLTTNALGLSRTAQALADAGLDRINASIDSVRPETFATITRRDRLKDVVAGLEAAKAAGLGPIKLNAVLLRGTNDDQAAELLHWAVEHHYELRFIEQMPLDAQHDWSRTEMVTADEIYEQLTAEFTLTPHGEPRGSAPAEL